jgi:hypothetical protein
MKDKLIHRYTAGEDPILDVFDKGEFIMISSINHPNQGVLVPKGLLSLLAEGLIEIEKRYLSEIEERHERWKRESFD